MKFIDNSRFMSTSLSNFTDNVSKKKKSWSNHVEYKCYLQNFKVEEDLFINKLANDEKYCGIKIDEILRYIFKVIW